MVPVVKHGAGGSAVVVKPPGVRDLGFDLLAFAGSVVCVVLFDWQAKDLIWGLWASSLCVGYAYIITSIVASVWHESAGSRISMAMGGLFLLAFFSVHFGMFHVVHSMFLNAFYPLVGGGDGFGDPLAILTAAFGAYWPFVLTTFISRFSDFPWQGMNQQGGAVLIKPYANVIRMHILIFVFAGLHGVGAADIAIYPVLLFYFFPWGKVFARLRRARTLNVELPTSNVEG